MLIVSPAIAMIEAAEAAKSVATDQRQPETKLVAKANVIAKISRLVLQKRGKVVTQKSRFPQAQRELDLTEQQKSDIGPKPNASANVKSNSYGQSQPSNIESVRI